MSKSIDFTFNAYVGDEKVKFESVAGVDGKDYITGGPYESALPSELNSHVFEMWNVNWLAAQLEEDYGI